MTSSADIFPVMIGQASALYPRLIGLAAFAYLLGSIPFGLLLGLAKGVDIRTRGSCNIGATNAGRVLGKKYFYIALLLDLAKGFVPTFLAGWVLRSHNAFAENAAWACAYWLMVGFAAVAGHNWPCWLKFKGGKGVATSLGIVLAIYPYYTWPGIVAFGVWILMVAITGYVSVGSMAAAVVFLVTLCMLFVFHPRWQLAGHWPLLVFASGMVATLIWRHRGNITRLRSGTENKFMAVRES